mmetsp:Transcript_7693/g.12616  ORF Transcript_7693/g.12616 Transcript_7693/m.12616 type:complete len:318 (+) Transcript_7693:35-988(+)
MARPLSSDQQILSQLLLFKGCVSQQDILEELAGPNQEEEKIDINEMIVEINRWHEKEHTALMIESYEYIDNKTYYGWRSTVADDVSKSSMSILKRKQISFWSKFLQIMLKNNGMASLNAANTLNRSGLLGAVENILTKTELVHLFATLERLQYLQTLDRNEFERKENEDSDEEESNDNDGEAKNTYYVLGPRCFIDLKVWMEQRTLDYECVLCSDYVMLHGFRCGNDRCPVTIHKHCSESYFGEMAPGSYICPHCQTPVDMQSIEQLPLYFHKLSHPDKAIEIVNQVKASSVDRKFRVFEAENENKASDEDDDGDQD